MVLVRWWLGLQSLEGSARAGHPRWRIHAADSLCELLAVAPPCGLGPSQRGGWVQTGNLKRECSKRQEEMEAAKPVKYHVQNRTTPFLP